MPTGIGEPPAHLIAEARLEWDRVVAILEPAGVLTQGDRSVLSLYCQAWGRWVRAEEKLAKTGEIIKDAKGVVKKNPYLAIAERSSEQAARLAAALGLDPSSRSRIVAATGAGPAKVASRPKDIDPPPPKNKKR